MTGLPSFQLFQHDFGLHLRDPRVAARPNGVPPRRARAYRELLFNNVCGVIDACFPVCRELLGEREILFWQGKEKAWLVDLRPSASCRTLDRQFKIATSGGFADLKVNGYLHSPNGGICRIDRIRPVNVEAMRADEAAGGELARS